MMDAVVAYHDGNGQGGGRGGGPMVVDGSQPGEAVRNGQGPGAQFLRRCDAALGGPEGNHGQGTGGLFGLVEPGSPDHVLVPVLEVCST